MTKTDPSVIDCRRRFWTAWLLAAGLLACGPFDAAAQTNKSAQKSEAGSGQVSRQRAVEVAPVGAGTTNATTTGTSHPSRPSSGVAGMPPLPNPSLCKQYQGEVQEQCLQTVLRGLVVDVRRGVSP